MPQDVIDKVSGLDDSQVVQLVQFMGDNLLSGLDEDDLVEKIAPDLKNDTDLIEIMNLNDDELLRNIPPLESAQIARGFLLLMAEDEHLSPILEKAFEEYKEKDVLIVETILSVGIAASLMLFASTIEIKGKVFGLEIIKKAATAEQIKAILEPFKSFLPKLKL